MIMKMIMININDSNDNIMILMCENESNIINNINIINENDNV